MWRYKACIYSCPSTVYVGAFEPRIAYRFNTGKALTFCALPVLFVSSKPVFVYLLTYVLTPLLLTSRRVKLLALLVPVWKLRNKHLNVLQVGHRTSVSVSSYLNHATTCHGNPSLLKKSQRLVTCDVIECDEAEVRNINPSHSTPSTKSINQASGLQPNTNATFGLTNLLMESRR